MIDLWRNLHSLFDTDDEGSLPDVFVENLKPEQIRSIYKWIRLQSEIYSDQGAPTLWDRVSESDVPIQDIADPAEAVTLGRAESFRHGLVRLFFSGVMLPQLTVAVYTDHLEFDYRIGADWGPPQVNALFEFLWAIQQQAPTANISHAYEGASQRTLAFADAWDQFRSHKNCRLAKRDSPVPKN